MSGVYWDQPWNPVIGCQHASPGCNNCYAERMAYSIVKMGRKSAEKYRGALRHPDLEAKLLPHGPVLPEWNGTVRLDETALDLPLRTKKPTTFFTSMGDWLLLEPRGRLGMLGVCRDTPWHTYLLCTKRARRLVETLSGRDPLHHVLIGVTVENRACAAERLPYLARIREMGWRVWVSYEPALEKVDFGDAKLDWLVAGAETGGGARFCDGGWLVSAFMWARANHVPFWCKAGWPQQEPPRERWAE